MSIDLPLKCKIQYTQTFFPKEDADRLFESLKKTLQFDKKEKEGRQTALYGDAKKYKYALNEGIPLPWTEELLEIKKKVEEFTGYKFNVCLCNYYKDGKEKMGFHSDQEELNNKTPIISISFGAERNFYFKSKSDAEDYYKIILHHGSLLSMGELSQENYKHALPRDNKVKSDRINLTFRFTNET